MPSLLRSGPWLVLLTALISGCAATPEASRESDAEAKRFESAPRVAIIYLYRADTPSNGGISTISIDGRLVGQTVQSTYFRALVRPGHNRISASGQDTGRLEIDTRENEVYFVAMQVLSDVDSPSNTNTVFRRMPPDTAKAEILRCCTMLETWRPGQTRIPL
jgi:hypothetical protein